MLVFVCSPFGGKEENVERARGYCGREVKAGNIPFAPHLLFPQFMDEATDRDEAIMMGLEVLNRCDELHAYGELTDGMRREIAHAARAGIPVVRVEE